jgi:hypothetical protein
MPERVTEESGTHKQWYEDAKKQTVETLPEFIRHLTEDYQHDYGTICHACAAAAVAACCAVDHSKQGGITGFQAGAIMWEFIRAWDGRESPLRLVDYGHMLYPQHASDFRPLSIPPKVWEWLQAEATKHLANDGERAHPDVVAHWQSIVAGIPPFGAVVKED